MVIHYYVVRIIKDGNEVFDVATIYYDKFDNAIGFKRYRPYDFSAKATKRELNKQIHTIQHIYAEALRYGFVDVVKRDIAEMV